MNMRSAPLHHVPAPAKRAPRLRWRPTAAAAPAAASPTFALPSSNYKLHRLLGFGSLLALVALLFQLVGDHRSAVHDRMARGRLYGHTLEVLFTAERLRAEVNGALQGERGYMMTHDEAFLQPFTPAEIEVPMLVQQLTRLTSDNPEQVATLRVLGTDIAEFMAFMDSEVVLEAAGDHGAAMDRMRGGEGLRLLAALTAQIDVVIARENRLLDLRRDALDEADKRTEQSLRMVFWLGLALLLLALIAAVGVLRAQHQVRIATRKLHIAATTDSLTGLCNRRAFFDELQWLGEQQEQRPLALATIDIDHFKSVNDRFGHPAGDKALCSVAAALKRSVREGDMVARIGGEEFAILFAGLSTEDAEAMCEKLRGLVARLPIDVALAAPLAVTLSVGLATRRQDESGEALIGRADKALYRAKQEGRNQVRLAA